MGSLEVSGGIHMSYAQQYACFLTCVNWCLMRAALGGIRAKRILG